MGSLIDINKESCITLLMTKSGKADLYVYDTVKAYSKATIDSVYNVNSKKEFLELVELANMQPLLAEKWVFVVEYNKNTKDLLKKYSKVFDSDVSSFIIKVNTYREYKEVKKIFPLCTDLYLSVIRQKDIMFILRDFTMPPKVLDFVSKTYQNDVDKVFELRDHLKQGKVIETQKDVVSLIGSNTSSISRLAFSFLAEPPKTEKGLVKVCKNRINSITSIAETFKWGTIKNYLQATVKDILDIKILYTQGIIYDSIQDLPECYDEKRLKKYRYQLSFIENELPLDRVLNLYTELLSSGKWVSDEDALAFIYKYYGGVV